jgi:hypothetical protein
MVSPVRGPVISAALALTLAAFGGAPVGAMGSTSTNPTSIPIHSSGPTKAQIASAIHRATRSADLWVTVNLCNTAEHPDVIGIRGQMPGLGFATTLYMDFHATYAVPGRRGRFKAVPKAEKQLKLGQATTGLHQDGVDFYFQPHAGLLSGQVTFEWRIRGKVVGSVTKPATSGHPGADFGDPQHFTAGSCRIK